MENLDIREEIKQARLKMWQVAETCGYSDTQFSKNLRHELSNEEKSKVRQAIKKLQKEKE